METQETCFVRNHMISHDDIKSIRKQLAALAEPLIGLEIYNRGDMANIEHFGRVVQLQISQFGIELVIETIPEYDDETSYRYTYSLHLLGDRRVITKAQWQADRAEAMKRLQERVRT